MELEEKQRQEELKKIEFKKEQERAKKEYEKTKFKAVEKDFVSTIESDIEAEGLENAKINFALKSTRNDVLKNVPESSEEREFLDANYEKILAKTLKIYENDAKAKETLNNKILQRQLEELQPKIQKENTRNNIFMLFASIFEHPVLLISLTILAVFVWVFMSALEFGFFKAVIYSLICFIVLVCIFLGFIK